MQLTRLVALVVVVLGLVACETEPATDTGYFDATVVAKVGCLDTSGSRPAYDAQWRIAYRLTGAGTFMPNAWHDYHCDDNLGSHYVAGSPFSEQLTGLKQNREYEYRLEVQHVSGSAFEWRDKDGTQNGTAYDTFRTDAFPTLSANPSGHLRQTIGINTRLPYQDTPHANCAAVKSMIQGLGIAETRDGLWPSYDGQWSCLRDLATNTSAKFVFGLGNLIVASRLTGCDPEPRGDPRPATAAEIADDHCASGGGDDVRTFDPNKPGNGDQCMNCKLNDLDNGTSTDPTLNHGVRARIAAFENVNEPDRYTVFVNWPQIVRDYQQWLWNDVRNRPGYENVKILGPTFASVGWHQFEGGELAPYMDECVVHPYPGDGAPGASIDSNRPICNAIAPNKPMGVTEMGWHQEICGVDTDRDGNNNEVGECRDNLGVSPAVQASYTIRGILENYRRGVTRTEWYTQVEQWCGEINDGNLESPDWGWHSCTWTRKPVADAVSRLTGTLGTGTTSTPMAWRQDEAPSDVRVRAFQRNDGKHIVAVWRAAPEWDQGKKQPLPVQPAAFRATVPDAQSVTYVVPATGATGEVTLDAQKQLTTILGGQLVLLVVTPE